MNAERLLAHFDQVADAPDAIPSLRRFVLDLAVRGKLVEQDPGDQPASELLKRIATERNQLVKAGEIRNKEHLAEVLQKDAPYALPSTWLWVRFGNIADFSAGRTPPRNDTSLWNNGDYPWVSIADMNDGTTLTSTKETISERARAKVFKSAPKMPGTIIMSFKLTIGKIARLGIPAFHNEAIVSIRPYLEDLDPLLFTILPELARGGDTKGAIKGATLNRESISNILIPLPPLAEQHRIVAKVDELVALCNRLEEIYAVRDNISDQLAKATYASLCVSDTESMTFRSQARFTVNAFPALTGHEDQVKRLRQTIHNLAVRGKVVEQDSLDEPASALLKRIAMERDQLVDKKILRRQKSLAAIRIDEPPFKPPSGWEWSRIGDAVLFTQYGTSLRSSSSKFGVPVLTMGNIQDGFVNYRDEKTIPDTADELPALFLKRFDLLYNRTNSAELVGKTGIYLGEDDRRTFASYLIRIRASLKNFSPHFLNLAMNTTEFRETQIVPLIKKQTGQANVNGTALRNMLIPVPPLPEQHRIVTRVDELMTLCDQLISGLVTASTARSRLLNANLQELLSSVD